MLKFIELSVAVASVVSLMLAGLSDQETPPTNQRGNRQEVDELLPATNPKAEILIDDHSAKSVSFVGAATDVPRGEKGKGDKDGVISTTDSNGKRSVKISHEPKSGIVVEVVRKYGADELDRATQQIPELSDYIGLFPTQVGDSEIEMSLSIKTVYRAATLEELKKNHPNASNLYRRYYKPKVQRRKK